MQQTQKRSANQVAHQSRSTSKQQAAEAGALQWAEAASLPHAGDANINEDMAEPVHHGSSQRPPTQLDAGIPKSSKLSSQQKMQPEVLQRAHLQLTNRATELCEQLTPVTIRNVSGVSQVLPKCCQICAANLAAPYELPYEFHTKQGMLPNWPHHQSAAKVLPNTQHHQSSLISSQLRLTNLSKAK